MKIERKRLLSIIFMLLLVTVFCSSCVFDCQNCKYLEEQIEELEWEIEDLKWEMVENEETLYETFYDLEEAAGYLYAVLEDMYYNGDFNNEHLSNIEDAYDVIRSIMY